MSQDLSVLLVIALMLKRIGTIKMLLAFMFLNIIYGEYLSSQYLADNINALDDCMYEEYDSDYYTSTYDSDDLSPGFNSPCSFNSNCTKYSTDSDNSQSGDNFN
jgi:hypothetical protein